MRKFGTLRLAAGAVAVALVAAACSSSSSKAAGGTSSPTSAKVAGGVVNIAESPQTPPNYIYPYDNGKVFSVTNIQFQDTMYRPLYWFGTNDQATVDYNLSLANAPTWSADGKSVTITLKPYVWSNGEQVTGADVVFFMNIYKATENSAAQFGGYVAANKKLGLTYFPDNVLSYTASGQSVTFKLDKAYSQNWFLYNELAQITPLPMAWDVTAAGKSDCATVVKDCVAVDTYLDAQSQASKTWDSSPVWSVVDGPWKLKSFDAASGAFSQVPNPTYAGPTKPTLTQLNWLPESSADSEYTVLKAGDTGASAIQIGFIPSSDVPTKTGTAYPSNPLKAQNYVYQSGETDQVTYYQLNYGNSGIAGKLINQLYFRQALQETIDQQGIISGIDKGWGYPSEGVVPVEPASAAVSPAEKAGPIKFSLSDAKSLLQKNGWNVSTSPATCTTPGTAVGDCGAGIPAGAKAEIAMDYATGSQDFTDQVDSMKSDAGEAGIQLDITGQTFNTIIGNNVPCVTQQPASGTAAGCKWQILNWGGGWIFAPDYYPTGEELFSTDASSNQGSYSNTKTDQLIGATTTDSSNQAMYNSQYPVMFMPNTSSYLLGAGIGEIASNLHVDPVNAYSSITPEDWYYTK
jgi:peptide/nickel transport system substrate-binding protein